MKKRNLVMGIAAGAAVLSVALLLRKNNYNWRSLYSSAEDSIDDLRSKISGNNQRNVETRPLDSAGRNFANKARYKAEHHLAKSKNGH